MAMVINTNMASLNAVRTLDATSREQSTAMERLTSGLRINRAADDAAGLAVAQGMTTQIRGTEMAIRNANDGIGMLQTLDGATEEVMNMMQRMRELAIQSMNGTYSMDNRKQMDSEIIQLKGEIQRVADTTKFNGMNIMNASSFGSAAVAATFAATSAGALSVATANASAMKIHAGWEGASNNRMGIPMLNFSSLSAIGAAIGLANSGISTYASAAIKASVALTTFDTGLSVLKTMRATWGALQNRLESTVSNLQNINENINESRSRIMDANFAIESASLARTQVLQQAGMSMLSQANQQSQQVLSLLQ
ncbi:flagellin FliC [Hydrogenovibrio sp. SC-1]|uniref:flagellin N-terminal helical domain-containing protein n=1 Tax=Hydrogenovibrio sp. SC-1 TaxID=2065820 RepID=UPI000C7D7B4F|nr:flagellin [Hydrogenovibrio sp. SC-1]PLA73915.1 flagellin FliC [Hydrogenovibrio sp. SC-1]PLA73918.1 flagellin FliC [Hydrogenovibrio sp. SC-1]